MLIAIVEDDREISKLLEEVLKQNNYDTHPLYDGREASAYFEQTIPDLILMDLMLPYKSGGDLIREVRGKSQVPIIVLSAKSMMETRLEMLKMGADDYILKPFDLDEVLVRVEVVLRRAMAAGQGTGNAGGSPASSNTAGG